MQFSCFYMLNFSLNITPQVSEGPRLISPVHAYVWCLNLEGNEYNPYALKLG